MIEAHTLTDGGQSALDVAERLAGFLGRARRSLDLALDDFDLVQPTAKVAVADDHVFAGSYNLSHSGELNAENVLEIRDAELAAWIDEVRGRYGPAPVPEPS